MYNPYYCNSNKCCVCGSQKEISDIKCGHFSIPLCIICQKYISNNFREIIKNKPELNNTKTMEQELEKITINNLVPFYKELFKNARHMEWEAGYYNDCKIQLEQTIERFGPVTINSLDEALEFCDKEYADFDYTACDILEFIGTVHNKESNLITIELIAKYLDHISWRIRYGACSSLSNMNIDEPEIQPAIKELILKSLNKECCYNLKDDLQQILDWINNDIKKKAEKNERRI